MSIEDKLKELNIVLPEAKAPVANYASFTRSGNFGFHLGPDQPNERQSRFRFRCRRRLQGRPRIGNFFIIAIKVGLRR